MSSSSTVVFAQSPAPQRWDAITIEGTVRNSAGEPVAGASVLLEEKGHPKPVETKTNVDGAFVLCVPRPGTYTVRAEKSGSRSAVTDFLVLSAGGKKHLDLVFETLGSTPSGTSQSSSALAGTMEFEDKTNFTVAGITDWSNFGTHGSDTASRTSEALTKETLTLKSRGSEETSAGASVNASKAQAHRLSGDRDEQLGDPLGAVREYEHAVRLDPSEQNYFKWGAELLLHKAARPAVEIFAKGSRAHPNSARMLAGLGVALYASGSYEDAARRLCEASDLKPADPVPYLFLGKIEKTAAAPLPCAEEKLARFARDQPGNAFANYYYAMTLWKRDRASENRKGWQQAKVLLEKAVTIDPKLGEAYMQLGILHSAWGDFEQAIYAYKKAMEANSQLAEAHYRLGLAYRRVGEESKAEQEIQVYDQIKKMENAASERQRQQLRQFVIILKDQPPASPPR